MKPALPCPLCVDAVRLAKPEDLVALHGACAQAIAAPVAALRVAQELRETVDRWRDHLGTNPCMCGHCADAVFYDEDCESSTCETYDHVWDVVDDFRNCLPPEVTDAR